jgi:hypothetical protein
MKSALVAQAKNYAMSAHQRIEHRRKYTGKPYDSHLKAVAEIVGTVSDDEEMIAAAWLHDVVEDTPATIEEIEAEFGASVAALVADLTDVSRPSDGNRAARKAIDRAHLAAASARAQTVKLADLIDNGRDITKHDPVFARVFLREMAALLGVLRAGDERLTERAHKVCRECARDVGLDPAALLVIEEETALSVQLYTGGDAEERRIWPISGFRHFLHAFDAADVAEPLLSFDDGTSADVVRDCLTHAGALVAGVRSAGRIAGYVLAGALRAGPCGDAVRRFSMTQVVRGDAALSEVVHVLSKHDLCFVASDAGVDRVIHRDDMQKPVVRMWLFGIVTIMEAEFTRRIRRHWQGEEWRDLLPGERIHAAGELQRERARRGREHDLLDCLQLSDKAQVLLSLPEELAAFGFSSRNAAKKAVADIGSLRNNLAHAQDIVSDDWPQIVRFARRLQEAVDTPSAALSPTVL